MDPEDAEAFGEGEAMSERWWASVDSAKLKSGVALWRGDELIEAFTLRPVGKSDDGLWARWAQGVKLWSVGSRLAAWLGVLDAVGLSRSPPESFVIATERGKNRGADRSLGWSVGYLCGLAELKGRKVVDVELSTWRRSVAEAMAELGRPISWPAGETKEVAVKVARELYPQLGMITDDEAEAVLIGHAAMRLRLVEV